MLVPGGGVVRSHRHHRARPLSFNATLEDMRHHHSTVTLLTFRSPPPTTVRRRHRPVRFCRRPIHASVTVILVIRGSGWTVLNTQGSHLVQTKTAHHDSCVRRCSAPQVALTRPRLSRFALHFAILFLSCKEPSGYLDSGLMYRVDVPTPTDRSRFWKR